MNGSTILDAITRDDIEPKSTEAEEGSIFYIIHIIIMYYVIIYL